jgi:hypothetical protein
MRARSIQKAPRVEITVGIAGASTFPRRQADPERLQVGAKRITGRKGSGTRPDVTQPKAPNAREAFVRRRLAAANAYPDEFVVLLDDRVAFHSPDRAEAVARYRALSAEAGPGCIPALVEPGKRGFRPDPVIRGRASPTTP